MMPADVAKAVISGDYSVYEAQAGRPLVADEKQRIKFIAEWRDMITELVDQKIRHDEQRAKWDAEIERLEKDLWDIEGLNEWMDSGA